MSEANYLLVIPSRHRAAPRLAGEVRVVVHKVGRLPPPAGRLLGGRPGMTPLLEISEMVRQDHEPRPARVDVVRVQCGKLALPYPCPYLVRRHPKVSGHFTDCHTAF